jgi:hypothetical protein
MHIKTEQRSECLHLWLHCTSICNKQFILIK